MIYAAIVAAWATFLVPRWLRRNEEVDRAREIDEATGVRVLSRRNRSRHGTHPIVPELAVESPQLPSPHIESPTTAVDPGVDGETPTDANGTVSPINESSVSRRPRPSAARRRRRILLTLVVLTALAGGAAYATDVVPVWALRVPGALLGGYLLLLLATGKRRVARSARTRGGAARARVRPSGARAGGPTTSGRTTGGAATTESPTPSAAGGGSGTRRSAVSVEDTWEPTPVPLPTYVTKAPAAKRVSRRIDLSTGAWTSGRLAPSEPQRSTAPPPPTVAAPETSAAAIDADDDDVSPQQWAVGD